ncbi:MAG: hypothetical protein IPP14_14885 [Planctomycetes bacterium]|nr:hypothetical protein [Planctomycetota bacterium]
MTDKPEPRKYLVAWLVGLGALVVIVVVDFATHHHASFERDEISIDTMPEFFPLFGLCAGMGMILLAKTLSVALKRKDTFYADD